MATSRKPRKIGALEPIAALNRIQIVDLGEPLVDIREVCPAVMVLPTVCPYLREGVARMLNEAQAALPAGYRLRVGTALRTLRMQKRGWDAYFQKMREEHPAWPLSALRRATNRYFAPYDQHAPPGHCTGGAVDVGLLGPDGEPLDMTSPTERWVAAYTWSDLISPEARRNRMLMVEAMLQAGFSNCREEYWHYSYGDSAWAVRVGEKACPYGWAAPPVAVEAAFEGGCAGAIAREPNGLWRVAPDAEGGLHVGVLWSDGRPVRVALPAGPEPAPHMRADEAWTPCPVTPAEGGWVVELAPESDRLYLALPPLPATE